MGQFTITLPDDMESMVRTYVAQHGYGGVSDFVREAVRERIDGFEYWQRFIAAMTLENNQLLRSAAGKPAGSERLLVALKQGYVSEYGRAADVVHHDLFGSRESEFVIDVLDMYGWLQFAVANAGDAGADLLPEVMFEGFDANTDAKKVGYVAYLVGDGRFAHVAPLDTNPVLNSDKPVNEGYRKMLEMYRSLIKSQPTGYVLTLDDVRKVLAARIVEQ